MRLGQQSGDGVLREPGGIAVLSLFGETKQDVREGGVGVPATVMKKLFATKMFEVDSVAVVFFREASSSDQDYCLDSGIGVASHIFTVPSLSPEISW